jgi:hypothetical protein
VRATFGPGSHLRLLLEQMVSETADRILARRQRDVEENTIRAPKH